MTNHRAALDAREERLPAVLEAIDRTFQRITVDAYRNADLISNEVLSRNPFTNALLHNVLCDARPSRPGVFGITRRLALYYARSIVYFAAYVLTWCVQQATPGRRRVAVDESVYVIDTFVMQDAVRRERRFEESHFPGLAAIIQKHGKRAVVLPRLYGSVSRAFRVAGVLKRLRESGGTFLTEFDLLRASDLLRTVRFILAYPFEVLLLARRVRARGEIERLVSVELEATLADMTFVSHLRYLVGRRLGGMTRAPLHIISWAENTVVDKTFYRGVRETSPSSFIFGCQPFVFCPPLMYVRTADAEKERDVTPDIVLVSGPAYLRSGLRIPYALGPSFRYSWLWSASIDWERKTDAVVFLSYVERANEEIVAVSAGSKVLGTSAVAVKPHPALVAERLPVLPACWRYSDRATSALIASAGTVITAESGVAVEAASLGSSVIIVGSSSTFTLNPMLELGRGEIWELVFDGGELDAAYARLRDYRERNRDRIATLAGAYRRAFFVEPSEERIARAFDLAPAC